MLILKIINYHYLFLILFSLFLRGSCYANTNDSISIFLQKFETMFSSNYNISKLTFWERILLFGTIDCIESETAILEAISSSYFFNKDISNCYWSKTIGHIEDIRYKYGLNELSKEEALTNFHYLSKKSPSLLMGYLRGLVTDIHYISHSAIDKVSSKEKYQQADLSSFKAVFTDYKEDTLTILFNNSFLQRFAFQKQGSYMSIISIIKGNEEIYPINLSKLDSTFLKTPKSMFDKFMKKEDCLE